MDMCGMVMGSSLHRCLGFWGRLLTRSQRGELLTGIDLCAALTRVMDLYKGRGKDTRAEVRKFSCKYVSDLVHLLSLNPRQIL